MTNVSMLKTQKMIVFLCLQVDDILIIRSNDKIIKFIKNILNSRFDLKNMSLANVILGIKILRKKLILIQSHYVDKIFKKFNKDDITLI